MLVVLGAAFVVHVLVQGGQPPGRERRPTVVRDSTPASDQGTKHRAPRRRPVTAEVLSTAFRDDAARQMLLRARRTRLEQDSALHSYDARVRQRLTARLAIGTHGPERMLYREESATRVQWQQGIGARVEVTGARIGIPMAPKDAERESLQQGLSVGGVSTVPYYPGQEALWIGAGAVNPEVDDRTFVEPIATGAEAYYTYASGDSMTWTLPNGKVVRLRELAVRPRSPESNLAVGSLWFDAESGQLVRAAYRLAAPIDIWARMGARAHDEGTSVNPLVATLAKAITSPMRAEISAVTVEYGLFDGRFWLPRGRSLRGSQQISFAHMPVELEQAFSYSSINAPGTAPAIVVNTPDLRRPRLPDSLYGDAARRWRDSASAAYQRTRKAFTDSLRDAPCDSSGYRVIARPRDDLPVAVMYPCNIAALVHSADFDHPLYDANEQLFGARERDALLNDALPFGAQALIRLGALPRPSFQYGLSMSRYNRVEGFSTGVLAEQQIGGGYAAAGMARFGFADHEPNAELTLSRSNLTKTIALTGYNRLVSASDWGSPLSFGSSVSALLFGRDEGFYYRATGAELRWTSAGDGGLAWRLFGEQQRTAAQRTTFSLGPDLGPNIVANRGTYVGAGARWVGTRGLDPRGFRILSDTRLEAAAGDSSYGRMAFDVTVSRGLPASLSAALTVAAGTSAGHVPAQRLWYLGGTETIRGQSADTAQKGNAFSMSRLEVGLDRSAYRVMAFGDLGWVGDRDHRGGFGRPMSGAGVGLSMFDGLVRFDVARGIHPRVQTRLSLYLQARY